MRKLEEYPATAKGICNFPPELLVMIFKQLDVWTLLSCKRVCRIFNAVFDVDLQYKIELEFAGMEDGPPSSISSKERLVMLRAHQASWKTLSWETEETIPMTGERIWDLFGGVLAQVDTPTSILFKQLRSSVRRIDAREWRVENLGFPVTDFSIDPSQDLLIVVEITNQFRIHVRSMTTGDPHVAAVKPFILCPQAAVDRREKWKVRSSASYVGVMTIVGTVKSLVCYNWRTGECSMQLDQRQMDCFAFITDSLVLVVAKNPDDSDLATLDVYDLDRSPAQSHNSVCTFYMPALREWDWGTSSYRICGDHSSLWAPRSSTHVPFYTSQKNKLFAIMVTPGGLMQQIAFVLLVPLVTMLPYIHAARDSAHRTVPWEEWGPRGARFLDTQYNLAPPSIWSHRAFGQTFIQCEIESPDSLPNYMPLRLYDCNPWSRARIPKSPQEQDEHSALLPDITRTDHGFFGDPVLTSLPCHVRTVKLPLRNGDVPYGSVMLSEDALVAMSKENNQFHVFTF